MTRENIKNTEDKQNDSRSVSRNDDRDSKLEIILPDGRKIIRRPTENLGEGVLRLTAPEKIGFDRRWVSDEIDGRIQSYINLGWVPATDENGEQFSPVRGGTRKSGTEYKMFLLEIPTKELERLKAKHKELDSTAKSLEQQNLWLEGKGQHIEGLTYTPEGHTNKIEEKEVRTPHVKLN